MKSFPEGEGAAEGKGYRSKSRFRPLGQRRAGDSGCAKAATSIAYAGFFLERHNCRYDGFGQLTAGRHEALSGVEGQRNPELSFLTQRSQRPQRYTCSQGAEWSRRATKSNRGFFCHKRTQGAHGESPCALCDPSWQIILGNCHRPSPSLWPAGIRRQPSLSLWLAGRMHISNPSRDTLGAFCASCGQYLRMVFTGLRRESRASSSAAEEARRGGAAAKAPYYRGLCG